MGATESKVLFRKDVFRLAEQPNISADDPYWTGFWERPESIEEVFSLFSPADIRRTRDQSFKNIETLISVVCARLIALRNHDSFPHPEIAPKRDALNCIRILTRLLPFLYESADLEEWEDHFFWDMRKKRIRRDLGSKSGVIFDQASPDQPQTEEIPEFEDAKPLAEELIDTLIDLLFFSDFTLPKSISGKNKVSYSIWQCGVGCNTPISSNRGQESNRTEILRLLLTLSSKSLYLSSSMLPVLGVKAVTYITTCSDRQIVLPILCSLLNTTLKYNPTTWRVPYDSVVIKDPRQTLVTYCVQLLLVLVLYPVPESGNGPPPKNYFRHYLSRLHRPQDFQFLMDGITRILNQPIQASSSYIPGIQQSMSWGPEMIMLFWEALQCNKRFRSFIVDTTRAHDISILMLFYAIQHINDPSKQGLIKMCIFVLQTLSVEPNFGKGLVHEFEDQETLPASIRIPNFHGTYADHLIASICTLLTTGNGRLDSIYPAMFAILNNIAAYLQNLSRSTCSKLLNLFTSFSSRSFLLANESNYLQLQSLLEALSTVVEHQYDKNPNLIYSILRSKNVFQALRDFTLETNHVDSIYQADIQKGRRSDFSSPRSQYRTNSLEGLRGTGSACTNLDFVPEESNTFVIGDNEDEDDEDANEVRPVQMERIVSPSTASIVSEMDESMPTQLRGLSEKARGKMPMGQPPFSRKNSATSISSMTVPTSNFTPTTKWMESWLPELPLHNFLAIISELDPNFSQSNFNDAASILKIIRTVPVAGIEPSAVRVHLFEWSTLSLGWYEALLWGFIFAAEANVSRGTAGVWNGTSVRLLKVLEAPSAGISLANPRGAIDAVGIGLMQRIGSLNLRKPNNGSGAAVTGANAQRLGSTGSGNLSSGTVRNI